MNRTLLLILLCALSVGAASRVDQRRLSSTEIAELKQAISDEIYDYGYYREFYQIGENIGNPQHWVAKIHLYINPIYNSADKHGEAIYKLMPIGQIHRLFFIEEAGNIALDGDPSSNFPITQSSQQTVYMDEEDVLKFEQSWMKELLVIDTKPSTEMIRSAAGRQLNRTGFSDWEFKHLNPAGVKK
jgi:hypothetical protein